VDVSGRGRRIDESRRIDSDSGAERRDSRGVTASPRVFIVGMDVAGEQSSIRGGSALGRDSGRSQ
jgi:hypothetical protein